MLLEIRATPAFRGQVRHRIVARRRRCARHLAAHRSDVSGNLPNLIVGDLAAERRHAVRPSLPNRRNDILDRVPVNPFVVREGGTDPAATMRMTAVTIHLGEERLALRQLVGVLLVILALLRTRGDWRSAAWRKRHHGGRDRRLRAGGIGMNVADLALAATVKSDVAIAMRVATGLCGRSIRCTDL